MVQESTKNYYDKISKNARNNALDYFENYSYKFRLFMLNEVQFYKEGGLDLSKDINQITIAETGSSSFYIDDVEIDAVLVPNEGNLDSFSTNINFKIIEPYSVSFFDNLFSAARYLNVESYAKTPLYLELTFTGYHPMSGKPMNDLSDLTVNEVNGATEKELKTLNKRVWSLMLQGCEVKVDEGGAEYQVLGKLIDDLAFTTDIGTISADINTGDNGVFIEPSGEIGELNEFITNVNNHEVAKFGTSTEQFIQYKVIMHENSNDTHEHALQWSDRSLMKKNSDQPWSDPNATKDSDTGEYSGSYEEGQKIQKYFSKMLSATSWASNISKYITEKVGSGDEVNPRTIMKTFRIEPQIYYRSFDHLSQNYNLTVVFHLWPYDASTVITREINEINRPTTEERELERTRLRIGELKARLADNFITKEYNYYYTGMNTDILNFDLKFDFVWQAYVAAFEGTDDSQDTVGQTPVLTPDDLSVPERREVEIKEKVTSINSQISAIQQKITALKEYQEELENSQFRNRQGRNQRNAQNETKDQYLERRRQELAQNRQSLDMLEGKLEGLEQERSKLVNNSVSSNSVNREDTTGPSGELRKGSGKIVNIEDLPPISEKMYKAIPISARSSDLRTMRNTTIDTASGNHDERNKFVAILNQQYKTNDFLQIEIEIRGDPYWLGSNPMDRRKHLYSYNSAIKEFIDDPTRVTFINKDGISLSDVCTENKLYFEKHFTDFLFLLKIYIPNAYNSDLLPGAQMNKDKRYASLVSGLYRVKSVTHRFSGGEYTQRLYADRDPVTSTIPMDRLEEVLREEQAKANQLEQDIQRQQNNSDPGFRSTGSNPTITTPDRDITTPSTDLNTPAVVSSGIGAGGGASTNINAPMVASRSTITSGGSSVNSHALSVNNDPLISHRTTVDPYDQREKDARLRVAAALNSMDQNDPNRAEEYERITKEFVQERNRIRQEAITDRLNRR